jgi:predicted kinase
MKPIFYMTVGLPGSGKSTWAKEQQKDNPNIVICSSDDIREELFGDANKFNDPKHNEIVFNIMKKRTKKALIEGHDVIYDATNISSKRRRQLLSELTHINCKKVCFIIATPINKCRENNENRDRKVPNEVIERMYFNWDTPYYFEGWDSIYIIHPFQNQSDEYFQDIFEEILYLSQYNQNNSHHKDTLGKHLFNVGIELPPNICDAGFLHDIGKPDVATFINKKGEKTEDCHYYNHENVGAYDSLFFRPTSGLSNPLLTSVLINLHMKPYSWVEEKTREKYKKLWGNELFNMVMTLHDADIKCH